MDYIENKPLKVGTKVRIRDYSDDILTCGFDLYIKNKDTENGRTRTNFIVMSKNSDKEGIIEDVVPDPYGRKNTYGYILDITGPDAIWARSGLTVVNEINRISFNDENGEMTCSLKNGEDTKYIGKFKTMKQQNRDFAICATMALVNSLDEVRLRDFLRLLDEEYDGIEVQILFGSDYSIK